MEKHCGDSVQHWDLTLPRRHNAPARSRYTGAALDRWNIIPAAAALDLITSDIGWVVFRLALIRFLDLFGLELPKFFIQQGAFKLKTLSFTPDLSFREH